MATGIKPKPKRAPANKTAVHYVDNAKLYAELVKYKAAVKDAEIKGQPRPLVSEYLGESIMKIATHLAYKPNFNNYSYRQEMVCDGIENCLQYIDNFDPLKSKNPFAYFTQIIYFAFVRRIQKEKRHLFTKYKAIEHANMTGETSDMQESGRGDPVRHTSDVYAGEWTQEQMYAFIEEFEQTKRRKRQRRRKNSTPVTIDSEPSV